MSANIGSWSRRITTRVAGWSSSRSLATKPAIRSVGPKSPWTYQASCADAEVATTAASTANPAQKIHPAMIPTARSCAGIECRFSQNSSSVHRCHSGEVFAPNADPRLGMDAPRRQG